MKNVGACGTCQCEVWIPEELEAAARKSEQIIFYCAYGHSMVFPQRETDLEKMRRERDRLAQQVEQRDDEIQRQRDLRHGVERRLTATRGVVTRIKNRIGHGVCPCCNRSFGDLARHMATKHPAYSAEAAE